MISSVRKLLAKWLCTQSIIEKKQPMKLYKKYESEAELMLDLNKLAILRKDSQDIQKLIYGGHDLEVDHELERQIRKILKSSYHVVQQKNRLSIDKLNRMRLERAFQEQIAKEASCEKVI